LILFEGFSFSANKGLPLMLVAEVAAGYSLRCWTQVPSYRGRIDVSSTAQYARKRTPDSDFILADICEGNLRS